MKRGFLRGHRRIEAIWNTIRVSNQRSIFSQNDEAELDPKDPPPSALIRPQKGIRSGFPMAKKYPPVSQTLGIPSNNHKEEDEILYAGFGRRMLFSPKRIPSLSHWSKAIFRGDSVPNCDPGAPTDFPNINELI